MNKVETIYQKYKAWIIMTLILSPFIVLVPFSHATLLGKIIVIAFPTCFGYGMLYLIHRLPDEIPKNREVKS